MSDDVERRLARLEAQLEHVATKEFIYSVVEGIKGTIAVSHQNEKAAREKSDDRRDVLFDGVNLALTAIKEDVLRIKEQRVIESNQLIRRGALALMFGSVGLTALWRALEHAWLGK